MIKTYTLLRTQNLPIPVSEAWSFFSSPRNLEKITPSEMSFEILTALNDGPIYPGMKIDYRIKPILAIPMYWTTEITRAEQPAVFTDKQIKGPYKLWEHTHTFKSISGGTEMTDEVKYALPFGLIGRLAHAIMIERKLKHIFDFRAEKLKQLFGA